MEHEPGERAAKRRALEDFYGGEVPVSTVDRVIVRDLDDIDDQVSRFVD